MSRENEAEEIFEQMMAVNVPKIMKDFNIDITKGSNNFPFVLFLLISIILGLWQAPYSMEIMHPKANLNQQLTTVLSFKQENLLSPTLTNMCTL